jgi:E3 ubiquitin-protein ligase Arkadia
MRYVNCTDVDYCKSRQNKLRLSILQCLDHQELLALEERIGNVNTGLNEESIAKCMRITSYVAPDKNITCALQDTEIKCSICQVYHFISNNIN